MSQPLLICTDLDRTLIPNGPQPESPGARARFATLVKHPEVSLAYVSGRDRTLVQEAIGEYELPTPAFVVGDVGTTMYRVDSGGGWQRLTEWEEDIARDWAGVGRDELRDRLVDLPGLQPQEDTRQNVYKISFYVSLERRGEALEEALRERLESAGVKARLIWSVDDLRGTGLLDILPARASKYHAVDNLRSLHGLERASTVFCGDSGNDLEVLTSSIPAVLVANAKPEVRSSALRLADEAGNGELLYCARGGFMGMNGHYSAGILEGVAHYHPHTLEWMGFDPAGSGP